MPNNPEMDSCKRICLNIHGKNFVNAVAYLSINVTEIFTNAQIENNKKNQLSEVRNGRGRGRGLGNGNWKTDQHDGCGGHGRGGRSGEGYGGNPY